jgi:hypothetical protein
MSGFLDLSGGTGYGRIDAEDAVISPLVIVAAFVLAGAASVSMFGYAFSDVAFTVSGVSPSIAFIVAAGGFAVAWLTNRPDIDGLDQEYTILAGAGMLALVGMEFVPAVQNMVVGSDVLGFIAASLVGGAFYVVSYLG